MAPGSTGEKLRAGAPQVEFRQRVLRMVGKGWWAILVRFWQGDPGLDAVHAHAGSALLIRGAFGMDDAPASYHPVYCARPDRNVRANRVPVRDRAFEEIGDRRKANVRVRANVEALAGRIVHRPEMIEEDERPDHAPLMEGEDAAHLEAAAKIAGAGVYDEVYRVGHARFSLSWVVERPSWPK